MQSNKTSNDIIKESLVIIKIGGNIIDENEKLLSFLKDFSSITSKRILVHGGGKIATEVGDKLGIISKYHEGRRITDDETIDLVTMVYGGLINKRIVARLQANGTNAIGITGVDGNLIPAAKRAVKEIDYGWVGDINIDTIDITKWKVLLDNDFVPVVAPLTHDGMGNMLNTNADTVASSLARALSKHFDVILVYCFEKNGVLKDVTDTGSVIHSINWKAFLDLKKDGSVSAGMIPKIENALDAIDAGVSKIIIGAAEDLLSILKGELKGTVICK